MSSREISDLTGKQHKHVLVDCDKLNENYRDTGLSEISADVYNEEKIDRLFAKTEKVLIWVCIGVLISWIILHIAL